LPLKQLEFDDLLLCHAQLLSHDVSQAGTQSCAPLAVKLSY
jgi:hypothetical protein